MRTIDTDLDMDYLSLLASTGQPSFKDIKPKIISELDPKDSEQINIK